MRRANRKDANHGDVVNAFRMAGCSVEVHEPSTTGAPDLVVGCFGINLWVEVKDGANGKLSDEQRDWHARWRGRKPVVVRSVDDALALVAQVRGRLFSSEVTG